MTSSSCPGSAGGLAVTFADTDQPGHLHGHPDPRPGRVTPRPSRSAGPSPAPSALATPPAASAGAGGVGVRAAVSPVDPFAPVRFAVDLFDVDESTIAPGSAADDRGARGDGGASRRLQRGRRRPATERPTDAATSCGSRSCCIVLVALCVEWALYHRDGLIRIRRSLAARLGRGRGATA